MLLDLINQETEGSRRKILLSAAISGAANAGVLGLINAAAEEPGQLNAALLLMFLAACALYALCFRYCIGKLSQVIEAALLKIRIRIAERIRDAELLGLEHIGAAAIHEQLTSQTTIISDAAWAIAVGLQSTVMLGFTALYVGYLSLVGLLLAVGVYGFAAAYYYLRTAQTEELRQTTSATRVRLFEVMNDFLEGFKELRLRAARSDELQAEFNGLAKELQSKTVKTNILELENFTFANLCQFALLAAIAFVLPQFINSPAESLTKLISGLVFMFGPIGNIVSALPEYAKANLAAKNIRALEQKLAGTATVARPAAVNPFSDSFVSLRLAGAEFAHTDAAGQSVFKMGPIDLTIRAGEIIFLVGGNGSGKTTLLRILTALYAPTSGTLYVNDTAVTPLNVQAYREMIAAVFTDFHLFKKLYGLASVDESEVQKLVQQMEIAHRVSLTDREWSSVALSTGQRKRVAMIVTLLEDRQIYVFDEWAADQDPEFRRYYYEALLPDLKRRGKTVIAISHDDRYFHCADRVITMEYGQIRAIEEHGVFEAATKGELSAAAQAKSS